MAISISYTDLKALSPCSERCKAAAEKLGGARKWGATKVTAADARAAGVQFDDIVWVASALARSDKDVERRIRLWIADCAARVLHIYERVESSPAPRNAIITGRKFARGEASDAASDAARAAARNAARAAASAAASDAAWAAARNAASDAARAAARAAAWAAARNAARNAASDAAWAATWAAEKEWQFDRLISRLSDEEPEDWPLPAPSIPQAAE